MKMGRFDDAISQYEQAVGLDPQFALSQSKIGTSYILKGEYEKGRAAIEKAETMESNEVNKVADEEGIVRSYIYAGDCSKALEASDPAIQMARQAGVPGEAALLHLGKGMVYCELKDYAAAASSLVECHKALEDPALPASASEGTEVGSMFWEVLVAAEQTDFAGAEAKLAAMKAAVSKLKELLFSKYAEGTAAFILSAKGDYAGADQQFTKANVDEPFFIYHAGVAKEKVGDTSAARKLLARVADWNEDTLWYAFVRNKAKAKLHYAR
jgi:tetratricopeptide (TPR) repeat protein